MDERLAALSDRVAAAADAWLTDPQDVQVYSRLVRAIRERRAYLNPTLDQLPYDPATAGDVQDDELIGPAPPVQEQPDEVLDGLADHQPIQTLRATLVGADPREILERLRRG